MKTPNGESTTPSAETVAEVDFVTRRTGLPLTPEERERFIKLYPSLVEMLQQLRLPETRYSEPALIFPATADR
ncbi:MAG TPA: hypothetical protein VKX96_14425 [Chloroflexota bacterium]|jgi:hypothetical protein|nr:hypothetical protein [Chloroflexota bacterium]